VTVTEEITGIINTFPVLNLLKCFVIEALFLIVSLNVDISQGSVVTFLRFCGILSENISTTFLLSAKLKSMKSGKYLMKLHSVKMDQIVWAFVYYLTGKCQIFNTPPPYNAVGPYQVY